MNKFVNISQLILSCIMLFAVVVSIVAHIILGNIASFIGWKIQCKLPPKTKRFCPLVLK